MFRVLALTLAGSFALAHADGPGSVQAPETIARAVDRYAQGDAAAATSFPTDRLTVRMLTAELERWTTARADLSDRRAIAATFALEAGWAATRNERNGEQRNLDPHGRTEPSDPERVRIGWFVAQGLLGRWCARHVNPVGPVTPPEVAFWQALFGFLQDGHAWTATLDVMTIAERRLPDDPRTRLARTLARTNRKLGALREPGSRRNDLLRDDSLGSSVTRHIPEALREFEALLDTPAISGEVRLRMAYLEMRRRAWDTALAQLEHARPNLHDRVLLATLDYFSGWIHEKLNHPDEAVAAYRRAHTLTPLMRNLSTSLAKLLFLRNERAEAYLILDAALNAQPSPQDLLVSLERGDARFVPELLRQARRAWQ